MLLERPYGRRNFLPCNLNLLSFRHDGTAEIRIGKPGLILNLMKLQQFKLFSLPKFFFNSRKPALKRTAPSCPKDCASCQYIADLLVIQPSHDFLLLLLI